MDQSAGLVNLLGVVISLIIVKSKRMAQKYIEGDIVEYDNKVMFNSFGYK